MCPSVIVIGAGVVGAAISYELAASGVHVQIIDARQPGGGATRASAGVLAPYIEGHEATPLRELGKRSLDLYDSFIERVRADSGRDLVYQRNGTIEVALTTEEVDRLTATSAALWKQGIEARWIPPLAFEDHEPLLSSSALGALLIPEQGFVGVSALTAALTVRPIRGQLAELKTAPGALRHVIWGSAGYLVPWPDGTVLLGATVEDVGFDEGTTEDAVHALRAMAAALVPSLADAPTIDARAGLRPRGPDDLPLIGASATLPGLIYATGHYRNGVLLAPLTAHLVKQIVLDRALDPALKTLSPARAGL